METKDDFSDAMSMLAAVTSYTISSDPASGSSSVGVLTTAGTSSHTTYMKGDGQWVVDPPALYRQLGLGRIGTHGPIGVNGSQGTPGTVGQLLHNIAADEFAEAVRKDLTDTHIDNLGIHLEAIIPMLEKLGVSDDHAVNAIKHLKYAKAFLDKRMLDKINEKINGDSKPNREEG